jgi:hypothetical protein
LKPAGLYLAEAHHERYTIVDFQRVDKNAPAWIHNVHFFMARKPSSLSVPASVLAENGALEDEETWRRTVPCFMEGCTAQVIRATCYSADGSRQNSELSFGLSPFPFLDRFPIAEDHATFLSVVLELIDGKRTTGEIQTKLTEQGFEITGSDLRELFHYLSGRHGILRFEMSQQRDRTASHQCAIG